MNFLNKIFYVSLVFLFLMGCSAQKRVAKKYIFELENQNMAILYPDYVLKANLREIDDTTFWKLPQLKQDSLIDESRYLTLISDSTYLAEIKTAFKHYFSAFNLQIYNEKELTKVLHAENKGYVINIKQIMIEEFVTAKEVTAEIGEYEYADYLLKDVFTIHFWYEISQINGSWDGLRVLYNNEILTDNARGYFTQNIFTGEVRLHANCDSITQEKLTNFYQKACNAQAEKIMDYFINDEINFFIENNQKDYYFNEKKQKVKRTFFRDFLQEL